MGSTDVEGVAKRRLAICTEKIHKMRIRLIENQGKIETKNDGV